MISEGIDSNNIVKPLLLDASGNILVAVNNDASNPVYVVNDISTPIVIAGLRPGSIITDIQVDNSGRLYASVESVPYDTNAYNVAGYNGNPLLAIKSILHYRQNNLVVTAGTVLYVLATVPANQIYHITNFYLRYTGTVGSVRVALDGRVGGVIYRDFYQSTLLSNTGYSNVLDVYYDEGDDIVVEINNATNGDTFSYTVNGFAIDKS